MLPGVDQRSAAARRFHDVLGEVVSDLGGIDTTSEGERQLAKRVAFISVTCEAIEAKSILGEQINVDQYCNLVGNLARVLNKLGLKRRAREVRAPTVKKYLEHVSAEAAQGAASDDAEVLEPEDEAE